MPGERMNLPIPVMTIGLLTLSNVFMTFAWYGHLRYKGMALPIVILTSWGIPSLISLTVFTLFSLFYLHESLRWNHIVGFALIVLACWVIFKQW